MGYPHFSGDCVDFHDRVIDWGGMQPDHRKHGVRENNIVAPAGVITLCGSTKFMDEFIAEQRRLTLEGFIVITVGLFGHMEDGTYQPATLDLGTEDKPSATKLMLDNLHFRKIDLANRIHVINKGGYIGKSTRNEIHYALWRSRDVTWMETPTPGWDTLVAHDFSGDTPECIWFGCGAWSAEKYRANNG